MRGGARKSLGSWGEALVAEYLCARGYRLVEKGWRCRQGEIDLIMECGAYICFVEVKLRKDASFAPARAFVDGRKQQRLRISALLYLAEHPSERQPRFDVAEVYAPQGAETRAPEIIYLEHAF